MRRRDHIIGQLEERASELEMKLEEAKKNLKSQEEKGRVESQQVGLLKQEVSMLKRHLVSSGPLFQVWGSRLTRLKPLRLVRRRAILPKNLSTLQEIMTPRKLLVSQN